jgi:glyceraldehyde 3-phosphate dehydrogenase
MPNHLFRPEVYFELIGDDDGVCPKNLPLATQIAFLRRKLEVNSDEVVSADIVGNSHASIVDAPSTNVLGGTMAKLLAWYDKEWGYSCRLVDLAMRLAAS